jgi:molecular chaperone GrpE
MSEPAPPGLTSDTVVGPAAALTREAIAAAVCDFQAWLTAAAVTPAPTTPPPPGDEPVDLHTLLGQFIALRHEVNLQTKATRAQQEQNAETLGLLTETLEALEKAQTAAPPEGDGADETRALLKTLVDLHDALTVGGREIGRVQETVTPLLRQIADLTAPRPIDPALLQSTASAAVARTTVWGRWFGGGAVSADNSTAKALVATLTATHEKDQERSQKVQEQLDRLRQMLASLAAGYTMSLQRIERALQKHGLESMAVVGAPFDAERMEVLEVVLNSDRPSGEVVEEVRRGYLWGGRVFRYAQVRVAKT